jgi:hypothetical protein
VQASVEDVDFGQRLLEVVADHGPIGPVPWDRLALTTGSVTRTLPTPGVDTYALGLKTLVEAQYLHDHVLRQLELADSTRDPVERRARLTFVVVGGGYTGTETAAQLRTGSGWPPTGSPTSSAGRSRRRWNYALSCRRGPTGRPRETSSRPPGDCRKVVTRSCPDALVTTTT